MEDFTDPRYGTFLGLLPTENLKLEDQGTFPKDFLDRQPLKNIPFGWGFFVVSGYIKQKPGELISTQGGQKDAMTEAGTIGTRARERCGEEHIDRAGGWKMMEDVLVFLSLVSRNTTCIKFWVDSNFWRKKTPESCFIGDSDIFSNLLVDGS